MESVNGPTTRRGFVKRIAAGSMGMAAANGLGISNATAQTELPVIGPKNGKYAKYVRPLAFQDPGSGPMRPVSKMDGAALGSEATIEFGTFVYGGKIGKEPYGAHVHDFDQVLYFMGGDCRDMGELNAEIELCLGEEKEKVLINSTTTVFIPKGLPHFPATIRKMDKRFYYMEISLASENKEKPVAGGPEPATPVAGMASKYRSHIVRPAFIRKAPGGLDPKNMDDSGGALAGISNPKDFATLIMCESVTRAPYRFPNPAYHTHTQPEYLYFHGGDPDDPTKLGGEVELYIGGKGDSERYIFNVPTVWIVPAGVPHCPLIITRVDTPFIMTDIRPFGSGDPSPKA
jgi:hypothetical protein